MCLKRSGDVRRNGGRASGNTARFCYRYWRGGCAWWCWTVSRCLHSCDGQFKGHIASATASAKNAVVAARNKRDGSKRLHCCSHFFPSHSLSSFLRGADMAVLAH